MRKEQEQRTVGVEKKLMTLQDAVNPAERTCHSQNHKEPPSIPQKMEETYITSEHSYQKPQSFSHDYKAVTDPMSSDDEDTSSFEEDQEYHTENKNCLQYSFKDGGMNEQVSISLHLGNFIWKSMFNLIKLKCIQVFKNLCCCKSTYLLNKSAEVTRSKLKSLKFFQVK